MKPAFTEQVNDEHDWQLLAASVMDFIKQICSSPSILQTQVNLKWVSSLAHPKCGIDWEAFLIILQTERGGTEKFMSLKEKDD